MVDTRNKRMSLIALGLWLGRVVANPDGAIDTKAERSQWALSYAMEWSAPAAVAGEPGLAYLALSIPGADLLLTPLTPLVSIGSVRP